MGVTEQQINNLVNLQHPGGIKIEQFVPLDDLMPTLKEMQKVKKLDATAKYTNTRGITIDQRYSTYALDLKHGDQEYLASTPELLTLKNRVDLGIQELGVHIPSLATWESNEIGVHFYDDPELGISWHVDNKPFIGVIGVLSLAGSCESGIRHKNNPESEIYFENNPGDLQLIRAPQLIDDYPAGVDVRTEHAVTELITPKRVSAVFRMSIAQSALKGFDYSNIPESQKSYSEFTKS